MIDKKRCYRGTMEQKEVFSADEAATFLGLHPDDVRRYARKGLIPCRKLGKRWLFHKAHLVEWLKGKREGE
jgi:excisionase family DNA binding protein